jgi:hypothetical protein
VQSRRGDRFAGLNIVITQPSKRPNHLHGRASMGSRTLRRSHVSFALGALALAVAGVAHADDVGCCEAECHASDGEGRAVHSQQRRSLTQAACESSFASCETKWETSPCDADGGHAEVGMRSGSERRDEADEE